MPNMTHVAGIARWLRCWALLSLMLACAASVRAADEPCAVFVMNVDGSNVRKLAEVPGYSDHTAPRWSHDGQRVVFEVLPAGGGSRKCFIVNADGSELREFGGQAFPSWSPDDKQIAFQAYPAAGQACAFLCAERRWQRPHRDCRWREPAVVTRRSQAGHDRWPHAARRRPRERNRSGVVSSALLRDVPRVCLVARRQADSRGRASGPGAGRQLMIVSAEGAAKGLTLRLKIGTGGFVSFSPDGKQLVLAAENKIMILDVDGTGKARWVPHQKGKNRSPDWSPDGKRIVFVSDRDAAAGR